MIGNHPNQAQRGWLSTVREALVDAFPGFRDPQLPAGRLTMNTEEGAAALVEMFRDLANESEVAGTPTATSVLAYLAARDMAIEATGRGPRGFATANDSEPQRAWIREVVDTIIAVDPSFAPIWDQVFGREGDLTVEELEEGVPVG